MTFHNHDENGPKESSNTRCPTEQLANQTHAESASAFSRHVGFETSQRSEHSQQDCCPCKLEMTPLVQTDLDS